ncbi:MAG: Heavy metal efflux outer membrane protein CzcC family [Myxococcales bacterium]|nr:Heavy metal efflux outer membrane protein CzcC family [Myxococcales bacterium]
MVWRLHRQNKMGGLDEARGHSAARSSTTLRRAGSRRVLGAIVVSASCAVGPAYHVPTARTPTAMAYKEAGWKVASPSDAIPRGRWWQMFHEPELDALEAQLNINNQTIALAFENYLMARAQIRFARASYFPTVTAAPSATWFRSSGVSGTGATGVGGTGATGSVVGTSGTSSVAGRHVVYVAPVDASWAPDLFGRVRYAVRQRQYGAQVSAADLESTRLLQQSMLAQTYFQIRAQDALQVDLDATVAANEQIVALTRSRFTAGIDSEVVVVQAELTLQNSRVQATNAAILRTRFEHAIATLIGVPATELTLPRRALHAVPPPIPTGTPSQLLERRPDIAAAERQMASANAVIGLGYAAYYPLITLTGDVGFASAAIDTLFSWPSRIWSIGANLAETLFDGGARRATIDQAIASYNASVANYRQTVLVAFQQVEDNLAATRILAAEVKQQRTAVELALRAFELERERYEKGLDPYINLAVQQTALLAARQALVSLESQQMTSAVLLVEALGGGWTRSALPTPDQVSKPPRASERQIWR